MGLIEKLAAMQHEIWAHWMKYMFSQCVPGAAGGLLIPQRKVDQWKRQARTAYADLSATEQKSDIEQAEKVLAVLRQGNASDPIDVAVVACGASKDELSAKDSGGLSLVPCRGVGYPWRWCHDCKHRREGRVLKIDPSAIEWDSYGDKITYGE